MTPLSESSVFRLAAPDSVGIEQLAGSKRAFAFSLLASVICSLIVAGALSGEVDSTKLLLWCGAILALSALRATQLRRLELIKVWQPAAQLAWQRRFVAGVCATGVLWALSLWLVGPEMSATANLVVIVVLAGLMAGASSSYSSMLPACYAFVAPVGAAVIWKLPLKGGDEYHVGLLMLAIVYTVMIAIIAKQHSQSGRDVFQARSDVRVGSRLLDLTRNELAQRDSLLEAVFKQAAVMVLVTDRTAGVMMALGKGFESMGLDTSTLLGRSLRDIFGKRHVLAQLHDVARNGEAIEASVDIGKTTFDVLVSPFARGDQTGCLLVGVDTTDQSRFRRLQERFVSNANHQLRTPLTPLKGALELLLAQTKGFDDSQRELLAMAVRNVERLERITEQIASLKQADSPKLAGRLEWMEVATFEQLLLAAFESIPSERRGQAALRIVNRASDFNLHIDAEAIGQLLEILFENACRYALPNTPVEATISPGRDTLTIAVINHGPAIEQANRAELFDRFVTADERDARPGYGLGLGLHVADRIIQRHDGRLWLERSDGRQTEFRFTLPAMAADPSARSAHEQTGIPD